MLRRSQRTCKSKPIVEKSSDQPLTKRKRAHYSDNESNDSSSHKDSSSGDEFVPTQSTEVKEPCSLNLSESDSDNDDQHNSKAKINLPQQSNDESEDDDNICQTDFDFTNILKPQETDKFIESDVKSKNINNVEKSSLYDNMDVAKMLSVGEGVHLGTILNDAETPEKEMLKRDDDYTIPDMVEINVKLPNEMKCKKGQDMQNLLRRRMNTICKETQVLIHKVHLLSWISYGNRLNNILNSPEVMGSALSLVPSEKAYPPKQCDLNYLENYIKWFSKKMKIVSKTDPLCKITAISLVEQFASCEAKTRYELIVMFISMLRSLGLNVRLVINLNVVSIKPASEQLLGPVTEEDHVKKPSTSESKVIKKKTSSKSEYFSKKSNASKNSKQKLEKKNCKQNDKNKKCNTDESIISTDEDDTVFVKSRKKTKSKNLNTKSNKSPFDPKKSKIVSKKSLNRKSTTSEEDHTLQENNETLSKKKIKNDFWPEVFLEMEEKWICVDVIGQQLHCIKEIYVSYMTIL